MNYSNINNLSLEAPKLEINGMGEGLKFNYDKCKVEIQSKINFIYNVTIEINNNIEITFEDKNDFIPFYHLEDYDFHNPNNYTYDLKLYVNNIKFIFKKFYIIQEGELKKGISLKLTIQNYEFNKKDNVGVWNLTNENKLCNVHNEEFKIEQLSNLSIKNINSEDIKKSYNAKSFIYYQSNYEDIKNYWDQHITNLFFMLRFYKGKFLFFPQTQIIKDDLNHFEIIIRGFDNLGEGRTIFNRYPYNTFTQFVNSSYKEFMKNPYFYNSLITNYINYNFKSFNEIKSLSGALFFENLRKEMEIKCKECENKCQKNHINFFNKIRCFFENNNFNLEVITEFFYKEIITNLNNIESDILDKNKPHSKLIKDIFNYYKKYFVIYTIIVYRNKFIHDNSAKSNTEDLIRILGKINRTLEKNYSEKYKSINSKTVKHYQSKYQEQKGTFWKGFRTGFKIGEEKKKYEYDEYYTSIILPILKDIRIEINTKFKEKDINLYPIELLFPQLMNMILIKLLNINCTLINSPEFYIENEFIENSKEYISKFLKD